MIDQVNWEHEIELRAIRATLKRRPDADVSGNIRALYCGYGSRVGKNDSVILEAYAAENRNRSESIRMSDLATKSDYAWDANREAY